MKQLSTVQRPRHADAAHVPARAPGSSPARRTAPTISAGTDYSRVAAGGKAMSTTGSGKIDFSYVPEPGDKSTKILFLQVMQEKLDGTPVKPGKIDPAFTYQDAYTTADFYHVDSPTPGEKDPFMNGDDPVDFGVQGNAVAKPAVPAAASDTPNATDGMIPAGSSQINWDFRTAAFSAAGEDAGTYYGYSDWAYEKQRGIASTTRIIGTKTGAPGSKFDAAVKLFNDVKGFKMPGRGGASLLGGIVGGLLGGLAGGLLGLALGGVGGAVIGGILGAVGGGLAGAFG
ncbi:hypothetical protein [Specibacter cremeus]|uniref:hypothetical protein n=1 Tax=Specibacter cremeus TaxID=1629051 RepID=UPI000F76CA4F|nr:hypothetical protein [Specibacter cremeus]